VHKALARATAILPALENAFGPCRYPRIAIVETLFQSAGGHGSPAIIALKPERLVPEHEQRLLDGYLPHELAHLWWANNLPPWIAESGAVFASYPFIRESQRAAAADVFLDRQFGAFFGASQAAPAPLLNGQGQEMYTKGGYLLVMLDRQIGGRRLVQALKGFLAQHAADSRADSEALSAEFVQLLQHSAGAELSGFVSDWVHTIKRFDPAIVSVRQSPAASGFHIQIDLQHGGPIRFPVPVRVTFKDGTTRATTNGKSIPVAPATWCCLWPWTRRGRSGAARFGAA